MVEEGAMEMEVVGMMCVCVCVWGGGGRKVREERRTGMSMNY